MKASGIEPPTCRFVGYCLNHYATACPRNTSLGIENQLVQGFGDRTKRGEIKMRTKFPSRKLMDAQFLEE
jgi:hypothetical protein